MERILIYDGVRGSMSTLGESLPWRPAAWLALVEERNDRRFGPIGLYRVVWVQEEYRRLDQRYRIWLRPNSEGLRSAGDYMPVSTWFVEDEDGAERMTYREALQAGYLLGDTALQRGYVSRNADPGDAVVYVAGGSRHGQLYVLLNNPDSNRYCIRQYLRKG